MYQETFVGINVTPKIEKPIKRAPTIKAQTIPENLLLQKIFFSIKPPFEN